MKAIKFLDGPDFVTMGTAGLFKRGEEKLVEDELATMILAQGTIPFMACGGEIPTKRKKIEE